MSILVAAPCQEPRGLAGDAAPVVVVPEDHVESPVAAESPDDAHVLPRVEGGCDCRVPQPVGPHRAAHLRGPAQPGDDPRGRRARGPHARVRLEAVEAVEQARFLRALATAERIRRLIRPRGPRVVVNRTVAESPQILDVTGRPTEAKALERDG